MAPILVPCLIALRGEFNRVSPNRDRGSDGWIGDRAHATSSSDHNPDESGATPYEDADNVDEVHAVDIDDSGPWPSPGWFDAAVEDIRRRHAAGADDRLQNIIRNGRIASRSWGWGWRPYGGTNGHYQHAHFSARYGTAQEHDTSPWGVEEDTMTPAQEAKLDAALQAAREAATLMRQDIIPGYDPGTNKPIPADPADPRLHTMMRDTALEFANRAARRGQYLTEFNVVPTLLEITQRLEAIEAKLTPPAPPAG